MCVCVAWGWYHVPNEASSEGADLFGEQSPTQQEIPDSFKTPESEHPTPKDVELILKLE